MPQEKIVYPIIAGPTASGKTAAAVALAKRLNGEVISADSMQLYADVSVGTARPTQEEMQGVPHHLTGFLPLQEKYSLARYLEDANRVFSAVLSRGRTPVLCGGTGLYIQSFMENRQLLEESAQPLLRKELLDRMQEEGADHLLQELAQVDPQTAARLHPNDHHRIVRALEVYYTTGMTITQQDALSKTAPSPYTPCLFVLNFRERSRLYERIDQRVSRMAENGLLEEAGRVLETNPEATVTQAIGYKELQPYFSGDCSLEAALDALRQQTRRYAKRQLSWFRRMPQARMIYVDDYASASLLFDAIYQQYQEFLCEEGSLCR
ncbi:MAG: tRNA (adenosine(37)-N6)-dimethylallyltransferase MiaA [Clostridia bacterium]|nr:tRNA (adenosine(37)-N6)-dimethylallyltransferase MiaA [Clostridia bacterium]